jgi:hypothetical protein
MNLFTAKKTLTLSALCLSLVLTGCLTKEEGDATVLLSTKQLTAGAQANSTYGSSINLDDFSAHTIVEAKTMTADIDLIFAYSTVVGNTSAAVYSPDSAKGGINGSAGFEFMSDFNNPNHTVIKLVTVNATLITTKAQLDSLWNVGIPQNTGRMNVQSGSTFIAESNTDRLVLVQVTSVVTGANGQANLVGYAKF